MSDERRAQRRRDETSGSQQPGGGMPLSRRELIAGTTVALAGGLGTGPLPAQNNDALHFREALTLSRMLRAREVSAVELMQACLDQIERTNPAVNAIPTLRPPEELLAAAGDADDALARGEAAGALHGLPVAIKDLHRTKGLRTTYGSPIYRDFVPDIDEIIVERLKAAGAIVIGKSNTPEFGAGSHTYNEVFGVTRNPYDPSKSCGGSSGGAAVALACGMVPLADGSDLGGSLRNPASFCNIVGFRPSPGRVPKLSNDGFNSMSVQGPMARTVGDLAFMLAVIAGPDARDPISIVEPGSVFLGPLERSFRSSRIAWSEDLGRYPVQPIVNEVCNASRRIFEELGCIVDEREPDFSGADEIFQTLRAWSFAESYRDELEQHRDLLKDTVIWNTEQGLDLTAHDIATARAARTALFRRVTAFLEDYEYLILPVSQVAPFPVETDWVREINGIAMETYIDWMASCYAITCTGLPAISVPCGFTPDGLPIGLQIVGRYRRDREVLELAYAFEQATRFGLRRPGLAAAGA